MPRRCDLWRIGVIHERVETLARDGLQAQTLVTWLDPGAAFTFDADPAGIWREGRLHLFVEHYDYRSRRGRIDCLVLDERLQEVDRRTVLKEPWHLSYPALIEVDGELCMLPEAHRSGVLTLYRCRDFPFGWERAFVIPLGREAIDATPLRHDGLWWLFFSSTEDRRHRFGSLHAMWAEELKGPWRGVAPDPLRLDPSGSRPGGRPFLLDGEVVLPVQDCSRTYGGAVKLLHFSGLDPGGISVRVGRSIVPPARWVPFDQGLHTLSGCGPVTLIDAKRIDRSGRGWLLDAARLLHWSRGRTRAAGSPFPSRRRRPG